MLTPTQPLLRAAFFAAAALVAAPTAASAATESPATNKPAPSVPASQSAADNSDAVLVVDEDDSPFVVEINHGSHDHDHTDGNDHGHGHDHADGNDRADGNDSGQNGNGNAYGHDNKPENEPQLSEAETVEAHEDAERVREEVLTNDAPAEPVPAVDDTTPWTAKTTSGFQVTYSSKYPAPSSVRPAINAAVAEWGRLLDTGSVPVHVNVIWKNFGNPNVLGYAGPKGLYTSSGLPSGDLYPVALANVLLGKDLNGSDPEIDVTLNGDLYSNGSWFYGTTGSPAPGQLDLMSVVAHEVGHGLGFLGSAVKQSSGQITLWDPTFAYDAQARYNGKPLANASSLTAALTSNNVKAKSSATRTVELYTPSSWQPGSSFGHLRATAEQSGSFMTPSLMAGTTKRTVDSMVLGVLQQMGWPTSSKAVTPTITDISVAGTSVGVTWKRNDLKAGLPADRYRLDVKQGGTVVASTLVGGTATVATVNGLSANTDYSVVLVPLGANGAGNPAVSGFATGGGTLPTVSTQPIKLPNFVRDEALDGQVFRVYYSHFLRAPDQTGFQYWVQQRANGTDLKAMVEAFANGPEFKQRYGNLSDHQFVTLVYRNVMGREPDARGLTHWVGQLGAGVSRAEVMIGFTESSEYIKRTGTASAYSSLEGSTRRLYQAFFLRTPDAGGLSHWLSVAQSGSAMEAIAQSFVSSPEFQQRYGSLSNEQFVKLVYKNVLNRTPDANGYNFWVGQLNAGVSRGSMMVGFSESSEFIQATGTMP